MKIKIGRKEYEVRAGDYILYNGAVYQFCAGDERTLSLDKWIKRTSLIMPKRAVKEIDFDELEKKEHNGLTWWTFPPAGKNIHQKKKI